MTLNKHTCKHCCFTTLTIKMQIQLFLNNLTKVVLKGTCTFTKTTFSNTQLISAHILAPLDLAEVLAEVISGIFYIPMSHHWLHRSLGYLLTRSPDSHKYLPQDKQSEPEPQGNTNTPQPHTYLPNLKLCSCTIGVQVEISQGLFPGKQDS